MKRFRINRLMGLLALLMLAATTVLGFITFTKPVAAAGNSDLPMAQFAKASNQALNKVFHALIAKSLPKPSTQFAKTTTQPMVVKKPSVQSATSVTDGLLPSGNLTVEKETMLPMGSPEDIDDDKTGPRVIFVSDSANSPTGKVYWEWYEAVPAGNQSSVGFAISYDGKTWTKGKDIPGNTRGDIPSLRAIPTLQDPATGTYWMNGAGIGEISPNSIEFKNGKFRLWFHTHDSTGKRRIGMAETIGTDSSSPDGLLWEIKPGIKIDVGASGAYDDRFVVEPRVFDMGNNQYRMYYGAGKNDNVQQGILSAYALTYATSTDGGNTWTKSNVLLMNGELHGAGHAIVKDGDDWHIWYETGNQYQLNYASSVDGLNWMPGPNNPVITEDAVAPLAAYDKGIGDSVSGYKDPLTGNFYIMCTRAWYNPPGGYGNRGEVQMLLSVSAPPPVDPTPTPTPTATPTPTPTPTPVQPPVNTTLPIISGITDQGQTLTTTTGSWTNSPTSYNYQWLRCDGAGSNCVNISGATTSSYLLGSSDIGKTIRSRVTAVNSGGSTQATSNQTSQIIGVSTFTVSAGTDDGDVTGYGPVSSGYPPTTIGTWTGGAMFTAGRRNAFGDYEVNVPLVRFNTSGLPDSATVLTATLKLHVNLTRDANNRNLVGEWYSSSNWPINSADYTLNSTANAFANVDITTLAIGAVNNFTLQGVSNVSRTGYTGLRLHVDGGVPTGDNLVQFAAYERGGSFRPQLVVRYSLP